MKLDPIALDSILADAVPALAPAVQLVVRWQGQPSLERAVGWFDPDTRQQPITQSTRFDLASVTKLFTTTTVMTLVEEGRVAVDQPVGTVLAEYNGIRPVLPYEHPLIPGEFISVPDGGDSVDAGTITFRHLLTHTSGLPAWRPLFRQADARAARHMALMTFFACQPGSHVIYSDAGLILLGLAIERLTGQRLDHAVQERVLTRLRLNRTGFLPVDETSTDAVSDVVPTEFCAWRGRRIAGQVHDENAYRLNGIAGHAGLFSTAEDVAALGQMYLDGCNAVSARTASREGRQAQPPGNAGILSPQTVAEMTRIQASEGDRRRGLGFVCWTPHLTGPTFSEGTFGHTGFTGTSLWIDPLHDLVVALLTNEVYHGRTDRTIAQLRDDVHGGILSSIDRAYTIERG